MLDILEHLGAAERAGQRVRHRARHRLQREHGVSPAADAGRARLRRAGGGHRSYVLGPRIYQLASAYLKGSDLVDARPAAPGGAARRGRRDGVPGDLEPGRDRPAVQGRRPAGGQRVDALGASGSPPIARPRGKVLLSGLAPGRARAYLAGVRLKAYTAQTITSKPKLRARARRRCASRATRSTSRSTREDLCCVSVPVRDPEQRRDRRRHQRRDAEDALQAAASCRAGASCSRRGRADLAAARPDRQLARRAGAVVPPRPGAERADGGDVPVHRRVGPVAGVRRAARAQFRARLVLHAGRLPGLADHAVAGRGARAASGSPCSARRCASRCSAA